MRIFLVWLLFSSSISAAAQTVVIPDANFRNKLLTSYAHVMQGNELDLAKAAAMTGTLDLRNASIANGSGIEHFTGITTLDLTNNLLTTLPSISAIAGLVNFYATNNKLTSLPDMSALTLLRDFQVMNNQLTALPSLSGTSLWSIYCSNNDITQLPPLTLFPHLLILVSGDNPFTNPVDVSSCTNLIQLHLHKTGIDTIVGLEKLKKLSMLFAWGNSIRNFSALDSIKTLTQCVVFDNPIHILPFLGNKPNLSTLAIANCNLTFEDIIPVLQDPPTTFTYSPQRVIEFEDVTAREKNNFALNFPVLSPHPGNIYVWVKDGVKLDSTSASSFTFAPLTFADSGSYYLKIYNPALPDLILRTETFRVFVIPCIEFSIPSLSILSKECGKGYTLDLSSALVSGGTAPFAYEVTNGTYKAKFADVIFENIPAGKFNVTIIDSKKCTATDHFILHQIEKCNPVITPNGDGIADSYFIEKKGQVKIYDLKRKLVNTLEAPVVWEGTNQNGQLLDAGYYILILEEEEPVHITIIR